MKFVLSFILLLGLFSSTPVEAGKCAKQTASIALKQGQLLSIMAPDRKYGGDKARKVYFKKAMSVAKDNGYKQHLIFNIKDKLAGDYKPYAFILSSWPSQEAAKVLSDMENWGELKELRAKAWDELKVYSTPVLQNSQLTFSTDKIYTLFVSWFDDKSEQQVTEILSELETAFNHLGARYMLTMVEPTTESINSMKKPSLLAVVEWPTKQSFRERHKNPLFSKVSKRVSKLMSQFEYFYIEPAIRLKN